MLFGVPDLGFARLNCGPDDQHWITGRRLAAVRVDRVLMLGREHPLGGGDLDAEFSLARVAIEQPLVVGRILPLVSSQDFTDHVCARIWQVFQHLTQSRRPIGFDEIVRELDPKDILGPEGCHDAESVADCVRQTIESSGTVEEARWCALRIRAATHRRSLLDLISRCEQAVIAGQPQDAIRLFEEGSRLAETYMQAKLLAAAELRRLRREATRAAAPSSDS